MIDWVSFLLFILFILLMLFLLPFVGYLWGRAQATGWIVAFKKSNLTLNKPNNGKTKEDEKTKI